MRIGIDLGGTKIAGVALADSGLELARRRVPTPRTYLETVDAIADIVEELERVTDTVDRVASVGVGIPGAVVPHTGRVKNANSVWLIGQPLGSDLERRLNRPIRLFPEGVAGAGAGLPILCLEWTG